MTYQVLKYTSILLASCALASILFVGYINRPAGDFRANVQPYPVLTKQLLAGGTLTWHTNSCHVRNYPFESVRKLKNTDTGTLTEIPEHNTVSQTPLGQCSEADRNLVLPDIIKPGNYKLIFLVYTRVNRWNITLTTFETDTFEVIK